MLKKVAYFCLIRVSIFLGYPELKNEKLFGRKWYFVCLNRIDRVHIQFLHILINLEDNGGGGGEGHHLNQILV